MNNKKIAAFAETLKKQKNGTTKQKRKLVVKTINSGNNLNIIINPIIFQQTGHTSDGKVSVR
jgi:hypothetical protein